MTSTSPYNIARAIYESSIGKDHQAQDTILRNATLLIAQKQMLGKSEDILSHLEKIIDTESGIIRARVTTAKKLSGSDSDSIKKAIKKRYKAQEVVLVIKEDNRLLDGILVEVGDERIDMSLIHKVDQLQAHLLKN